MGTKQQIDQALDELLAAFLSTGPGSNIQSDAIRHAVARQRIHDFLGELKAQAAAALDNYMADITRAKEGLDQQAAQIREMVPRQWVIDNFEYGAELLAVLDEGGSHE